MAQAIPGARAVLEQCGYTITFRVAPWTECLVALGSERWVGAGLDEDDALAHALHQMLPSGFVREIAASQLVSRAESAARAFSGR